MTDAELDLYIAQIRARRTSQQLSRENEPQRRGTSKAKTQSESDRQKSNKALLSFLEDDEEDQSATGATQGSTPEGDAEQPDDGLPDEQGDD